MPDGSVVDIATTQSTGAIDDGSTTSLDPFVEHVFDKATTYRLKLASFRDYLDGYKPDVAQNFVAADLAYQLNISLPRHAKDDNVFSLPGKKITLVEGAGASSAPSTDVFIKSYDASTKIFSLRDAAGNDVTFANIDHTSVFEVTYDISSVTGYTPINDEYSVVLTSQPAPGETVTIQVDPQLTRNYDEEQAFVVTKVEDNNVTKQSQPTFTGVAEVGRRSPSLPAIPRLAQPQLGTTHQTRQVATDLALGR